MDVHFATNQLERCYGDEAQAIRQWGPVVGRAYIRRISTMILAKGFNDLFPLQSFRLHPLTGARVGEWSITLQGRWRLIVTRESETVVGVQEVTNHCGD